MSYITKVLASGDSRDICNVGATREALAVSLMTQLRLKMIKRCRDLQHRQIYRIKREQVTLILKVPLHVKSSTAISLSASTETRDPDTVRKYFPSHSITELFCPADQRHAEMKGNC
jgi:hypothetical protein